MTMSPAEESAAAVSGPTMVLHGPQAESNEPPPSVRARYLNVEQACELLQIGRSTFYRLLANPDSRLCDVAVRIPVMGHLRFPEGKLKRWLEGRMPRRRSGT